MNISLQLSEPNLASRVYEIAKSHPSLVALTLPTQEKITYSELATEIDYCRTHLLQNGLKGGDHVLVFLKTDRLMIVLMFALLAEAMVPVFLDPRLPVKHWKKVLRSCNLKAIFAPSVILRLRYIWWFMNKMKLWCSDPHWRVPSFDLLFKKPIDSNFTLKQKSYSQATDTAMIALSSGTTGEPKVIQRTYGVVRNQQYFSMIHLPKLQDDRHLALYGVSILQSITHGCETILCDSQNLQQIMETLKSSKPTRLSGPPGMINRITQTLLQENRTEDSILSVMLGAAPIQRWLCKQIKKTFPNAKIYIIYGCTESEPIAFTDAEVFLKSNRAGYCVGRPIPEVTLHQINPFHLPPRPHSSIQDETYFEVGLSGPHVLHPKDSPIHATGDIATLDSDGALWLLGRTVDQIDGVPSGLIEEPIENLPGVQRVAIKKEQGSISVYIQMASPELRVAPSMIHSIFDQYGLKPPKIQYLPILPVDARHQWKIQKGKLLIIILTFLVTSTSVSAAPSFAKKLDSKMLRSQVILKKEQAEKIAIAEAKKRNRDNGLFQKPIIDKSTQIKNTWVIDLLNRKHQENTLGEMYLHITIDATSGKILEFDQGGGS